MKLIQQSMLIRDTPNNIYAALTSKEDLKHWWGLVNDSADGETVWYGMDRQYEVPIVASEPGKMLSFAFDSHHPYTVGRTEPTTITITVAEREKGSSIVTVVQSMFSDDDWNTLIHDGWVYSLLSLQLWVERGIAFSDWMNASKFHSVNRVTTLSRDAEWAWDALSNGSLMNTWLEAEVDSDPVVGGEIRIEWDEDTIVGGEWVLLSEPRNLVCHWWDAKSLADRNDPGNITVQMWTILPAVEGSIVKLTEFGYDLKTIGADYIASIESGWDQFMGNLQKQAATEE